MEFFVPVEKSICRNEEDLYDLQVFVGAELPLRPSIADQLRVGFFSADHATQTDSSEILEIKEVTNLMHVLGKSFNCLKRDFLIYKNSIKGDYEEKIQEQVSNLYTHINETAQNLEAGHRKKMAIIRQSFRQQLADAIAVIKKQYELKTPTPSIASTSSEPVPSTSG
ncbi:uncharacterized protein C10orf67 homolog, mitochondrial [Rhinatrema bivittatum]|uniref:uncharacterized protein C10orf67 homolog, mitochondrial n=1 Tax=Rhinatrema bivittatum TaxID=194408 RepID=UPI00112A0157|nr:uncharacterized protein C10orf67 homolog, mitochondrial [Rhinatrema bivittatum]